jgi:hypothetical protein
LWILLGSLQPCLSPLSSIPFWLSAFSFDGDHICFM